MATTIVPGTLSGEEMVALTKQHTLFEWSAQGEGRSDPGRRARRALLLDAGGQALHGLQQPADVREHRPRRPAGHRGDPGAGGARSPTPTRSWPRSRARGSARSSPRSRPATSTCSSSPTAAPRPTRTRSRSRGSFTGRHKILARYRSYHGGTAGRDDADRRSAPLGGRARHARRRARARLRTTGSERGWDAGRAGAARSSRR